MSRLAQLEEEVSRLAPEELRAFRNWFAEFDARRWDDQIRADARAGKLDHLVSAARRDYDAGRTDETPVAQTRCEALRCSELLGRL